MMAEEKAKAPFVYRPTQAPVRGKRLEDIEDLWYLRKQVERLFSLLDDIELLGEVFAEDHVGFRQRVQGS